MPGRPPVQFEGVLLHIARRGPKREPCFFDGENYPSYLHSLSEVLAVNQCQLHAYVLMTTHVHLLVTQAS